MKCSINRDQVRYYFKMPFRVPITQRRFYLVKSLYAYRKMPQKFLRLEKTRIFYELLKQHRLCHDRAKGRMRLVTSYQAFTRIASVIVLTGSLLSAFSTLLKERLFSSKKVITYIDNVVRRCQLYSSSYSEAAETNVEYNLEVEFSSNAREQEDTSDDDKPEDANEPLSDENWLAEYETERQRRSCFCSDQYSCPRRGLTESIFIQPGVSNTPPNISWVSNKHALISGSRRTSLFFCDRVISHVKRKWMKGYALFLVWPAVASKNKAFIRHFLSCNRNKDCPKQERDQWPGMTSQITLYSDYFF